MAIGPDTAPTQVLGCRPGGAAGLRLTAPPPRPSVAAPARQRRAGSWGSCFTELCRFAPPRAAVPIPHPCAVARPPCRRWRQGPRKQPRPCQKAVYCILCSRRRPLPAASAAGKRSARSPQHNKETALRDQLRRLPRLRGKGGAADRGAALHEKETRPDLRFA